MAGWVYPPELEGQDFAAIGARLRLTREALGMQQKEFAELAGVQPTAYNQYETGKTRPGIDNAIALVQTHRLSLDWVYLGKIDSLRSGLHQAIVAQIRVRQGD